VTSVLAPARKPARAVNRAPQDTRGTWKTYLLLSVVLVLSAFPVYWMFVIATSTDAAVSKIPPSVIPGSQLFHNLHEVLSMSEVYFTASLINSFIVSLIITVSTLFFCSLAGFAFAKLRFPARNALMFVVILTLFAIAVLAWAASLAVGFALVSRHMRATGERPLLGRRVARLPRRAAAARG